MSLKTRLYDHIVDLKGETFTYDQLVSYCRTWGYKIENGSRRTREIVSMENSPIEVVKNKKKIVVGWKVKPSQGRLF